MSIPIPPTVARTIRTARRRLVLDTLLNRVAVAVLAALVIGLLWFLAEPWLLPDAPIWLRWVVPGGTALVGTLIAVTATIRTIPDARRTALELDARFGLRERLTTAYALRPEDHSSPAAEAVLADAESKVATLTLSSQFPIRLRRPALAIPVCAIALIAVSLFYHPDTRATDPNTDPNNPETSRILATLTPTPQPASPFSKPASTQKPRENKSEELKELENEINRLMDKYTRDQRDDSPEKYQEKVTELTKLQEKLQQFEQEKFEKLARMERQLRELDTLAQDKDFADGPAQSFNKSLAKGDLKQAKEEIDELRKKAKKDKLDPQELQKLDKQLDKMAEELQRLSRNSEREQKLKDLIEQARKEGRDAESLERELDKLRAESKESSEAMQQLAQQLQKAQQAAARGDLEDLAEQLDQAGKQLEAIEGELQDIEEAEQYLQRLKAEREVACKQCQGQGQKPGDALSEADSDQPNPGGIGKGRRAENRDAQTAAEEERIRGLFDPRGQKSFGGSVRGQAFNKRTTADYGQAIQEAVQEAPQAADAQRLPRDAVDTVKGYFQNLGGQTPTGK